VDRWSQWIFHCWVWPHWGVTLPTITPNIDCSTQPLIMLCRYLDSSFMSMFFHVVIYNRSSMSTLIPEPGNTAERQRTPAILHVQHSVGKWGILWVPAWAQLITFRFEPSLLLFLLWRTTYLNTYCFCKFSTYFATYFGTYFTSNRPGLKSNRLFHLFSLISTYFHFFSLNK